MTDGKTDREAGFSLIEMIFALTLLAAAFLVMGRMFVVSTEHSRQGRHDMIALNSAHEILERMRAVRFDDVEALFDGLNTAEPGSVPAEAREWADHLSENLGPSSQCRIHVYDDNDKPTLTNGLLEVEILMSWTERGRERTMRTGTFLVRMGSQ